MVWQSTFGLFQTKREIFSMSFLENISLRIMFFLNYDSLTVRIVGKAMTSRIAGLSVRSITRRSMP